MHFSKLGADTITAAGREAMFFLLTFNCSSAKSKNMYEFLDRSKIIL
jgi:hypothetical protein